MMFVLFLGNMNESVQVSCISSLVSSSLVSSSLRLLVFFAYPSFYYISPEREGRGGLRLIYDCESDDGALLEVSNDVENA